MKPHRFALLALTILIIASLACSSTKSTSVPKISTATTEVETGDQPIATEKPASSENTQAPAPTDAPEVNLYLGDAVSKDGYALTAVSVQDPAKPGMFYKATNGKKLIAVEVILSNLSGDPFSINTLYATLLDTEGFTYKAELAAVDDQIATLNLTPGEKVKGLVGFEIPEKAVVASIKYPTSAFGGTFLQASLAPAPADHVAIAEPASNPITGLPKLGDAVENFGYSLTATTVQDPATPGIIYQPKQGYKLVAVEIVLQNVSGSDTLSINPLYAYLVDSNGFVYRAELGGVDDQIDTGDLGVGEKSKGWVSFKIPDNAIPASIKYSTQVFSDNSLQVGLTK